MNKKFGITLNDTLTFTNSITVESISESTYVTLNDMSTDYMSELFTRNSR